MRSNENRQGNLRPLIDRSCQRNRGGAASGMVHRQLPRWKRACRLTLKQGLGLAFGSLHLGEGEAMGFQQGIHRGIDEVGQGPHAIDGTFGHSVGHVSGVRKKRSERLTVCIQSGDYGNG